jgi:hypothetical protein
MAMAIHSRCFSVFYGIREMIQPSVGLKKGVTENHLFLVGFFFGVRGHAEEV